MSLGQVSPEGASKARARKKWAIDINKKWCKACRICVEFCPKKVLDTDEFGKAEVGDIKQCTGCGLCEMRCPDFAIVVREIE